MALTPSAAALPTLEGCVHGIVGLNPARIQCDECHGIYEGDPNSRDGANIILSGIRFNSRRYHQDNRRLCKECRAIHWKGERE